MELGNDALFSSPQGEERRKELGRENCFIYSVISSFWDVVLWGKEAIKLNFINFVGIFSWDVCLLLIAECTRSYEGSIFCHYRRQFLPLFLLLKYTCFLYLYISTLYNELRSILNSCQLKDSIAFVTCDLFLSLPNLNIPNILP